MKYKPSRMVSDRNAISNTVLAAINVHSPEVVATIEEALFPDGPPKDLTVSGLFSAIGALLARRTDALAKADLEHALELADDDPYRRAKEEKIADMRGYFAALTSSFDSLYGPKVAAVYGLGAAPPEDAPALLTMARTVEHLLRTRPLTEAPKRKGMTVDPIALADNVKMVAAELSAAVDDVERERREAQLTQNKKNEAMAGWSHGYQGAADLVTALFALANRQDLAERVRPTARRRAGLPEVEDTPPDAEQSGGAPQAGDSKTPEAKSA
jgi:hypothetical protein